MNVGALTDVGRIRSENEDFVFASEEPVGNLPNLFVVADGMGGHSAGEFASKMAVSVIVDSIKGDMSFNPIKIIRHAIETANEQIIEYAEHDITKKGMGTTLVAVTMVGYYAYVANVGDSRLYVVDEHEIMQITRDHSWVAEMVRRGEMTPEDAKSHPDKNIITRALGAAKTVEIDFFDVQLEDKSKIVMCSDGLSNMVSDQEIHQIVEEQDTEHAARQLVERANEYGGRDNISVIVVEPFTNEVKEC